MLDKKKIGLDAPIKAADVDGGIRSLLDAQSPGWETRSAEDRYCALGCLIDRWKLERRLELRLIGVYMRMC